MVRVLGHRGASMRAPENTLAAFRLALECGADGVECDVRATADGVPVILHDATVDRVSDGSGEVRALTLAEVQACRVTEGSEGYREEFGGERIPTLAELLDLVAGRGLLVLEFKALDAVAPSVGLLRRRDAASWCTAWSFSADVLVELKRLMPELSRSQNVGRIDSWDAVLETARELQCLGVSLNFQLIEAERVRSATGRGLEVYAWTPNRASDWQRLVAAGVDALCTDDPGGLRGWLAERGRAGVPPQPLH